MKNYAINEQLLKRWVANCTDVAIREEMRCVLRGASEVDPVIRETSITQAKLQAMSIARHIEAEKPLALTSEQAAILKQILRGYMDALDFVHAYVESRS